VLRLIERPGADALVRVSPSMHAVVSWNSDTTARIEVDAFIDAGLPVAISVSWNAGELPGAPLEHSEGHLLVVHGVDGEHVAYLVAPRTRTAELVALANVPS
jgi:hypothetical protein